MSKPSTHTLYNPAAKRTGIPHYATYTILGDAATVDVDDCTYTNTSHMSTAEARSDYRKRISGGWRKY